jgi:ATP/maltotriose-dependent transcriptional regulator MalT/DNA-binding SARP family transcriptional activator
MTVANELILHRPRLLRRVQAALRRGHVAIIAPGGYGKTVLLHALATQRPDSHYLPLTAADADLAMLQARLNSLIAQPKATLLLDDIQHLADVSETRAWLMRQLVESPCRFVLCGRQLDLPASPEPLIHFSVTDLAFTPQESRALLSDYPVDTARAWHARIAGWPLALALLSRIPETSLDISSDQTRLFDHLAQSFFTDLPPDLLRFVRLTAIPLRFNVELAALLVEDNEAAAQVTLAEVQRRQLFLETISDSSQTSSWFRYHELVRDFLVSSAPLDPLPLYERVIHWFDQRDDFEQAIEHALLGRLYELAAQLLLEVPPNFAREQGRHLTYRRWVLSLPNPVLAANLTLLTQLSQYLFSVRDFIDEAWQHLHRVLALAEQTNNQAMALKARSRLGLFHYRHGQYDQALQTLGPLRANPALLPEDRRLVLRALSNSLAEVGRYRQARRIFLEAIHLARDENDLEEELFNRQNLALNGLMPLGDFAAAAEHLQTALDHYANAPGLRLRCLLITCDLHLRKGDWAGLEAALQEMDALSRQLDVVETADQLWPSFYWAVLEIGQGRLTAARESLNRFASLIIGDYSMALICRDWLESWLLRRQGRLREVIQLAETVLANSSDVPYYRSQIALCRDIARQHLLTPTDPPLAFHPEIINFIRWRARADLVHLRALLALDCWRCSNPRWRRHARAALRALQRPGFERLLTARDPDLGASFWTMCLAAGLEIEQAVAALKEIGQIEPVLALLDPSPTPSPKKGGELLPLSFQERGLEGEVRARAAQALAAIGHEAAIPALAEALQREPDAAAAAALEAALTRLETLPPPFLEVQLLGDFAVQRDGRPIAPAVWPRPIVRRLFQYFALQRGQRLPRDRILDDLWPDTTPQSAWSTFRTVYSRLRSVLEPFLRPKAPSRYFMVEGDTYCFDPFQRVSVDVEQFERLVRTTLAQAGQHDLPPLNDDLLAALARWQPLLPDLPYEEWLIARREQLHTLYVEGCLYAAQAYLVHNELHQAMLWARQVIAEAPWLEEAYQILMRGHARLDERSLALKVYETAVAALERELGASPSRLTRWLAERLRRGEEI